jgi:hypothetical protein
LVGESGFAVAKDKRVADALWEAAL